MLVAVGVSPGHWGFFMCLLHLSSLFFSSFFQLLFPLYPLAFHCFGAVLAFFPLFLLCI